MHIFETTGINAKSSHKYDRKKLLVHPFWYLYYVSWQNIFEQLKRPDYCLVHMTSTKCDHSLTSYLRHDCLNELPKKLTDHYTKSFLGYCKNHIYNCNVHFTFNPVIFHVLSQPLAATENKDISFVITT